MGPNGHLHFHERGSHRKGGVIGEKRGLEIEFYLEPNPGCIKNDPRPLHGCRYRGMEVVIGTHPIPQKYYLMHQAMGTWDSQKWLERIRDVTEDETVRLRYD